jgi:hypothetical protein
MATRWWRVLAISLLAGALSLALTQRPHTAADELEMGWRNPPADARPHAYWLWLNGYVDPPTARAELEAMQQAGFSGVLLFDMGAAGDASVRPPAGPAFLSPEWLTQFGASVADAKRLGLQVDFSVTSSWDMGGPWIKPEHASMGLYPVETVVEGGRLLEIELPFPPIPAAAPRGPDGRPAFWRDAAVLALHNVKRSPTHDFVFRLDCAPDEVLVEAVLDNGTPGDSEETATMSPVREFSLAVSHDGLDDASFREVLRGTLPPGAPGAAGARRYLLPAGTRGPYVRLRLHSAHDSSRPRWTLGEFAIFNAENRNVAAAHVANRYRSGAEILRASAPFGYGTNWNLQNLHDGQTNGPAGVFATAGAPPLHLDSIQQVVPLTSQVNTDGRLSWQAPEGHWTILRYVVMNTGERLKVPSPHSDGWATDHFNPQATQAHMSYVLARLRETFGELHTSGLSNLYLASYEVVGPVWSPEFPADFKRLRGYDLTPYLPALFGATVGDRETTRRFLFDYRKTLSDVLISAYYRAAREAANRAGLGIKSEAGGPGPPVHNVPVDSLLANAAVDEIQGEFWPYRPQADSLWVVKETASAGHLYAKPRVHMEAFTSFEAWREGPQDLKESADRVFCEGGNHMVWHTWSHAPPSMGRPGAVYLAGTHLNRNVTWWPKIKPFVDYLSRSSYLLQRGHFIGDVLYYYGDGGYRFVPPRRPQSGLGAGYDYDVTNSDVILNRLSVRQGRFVLPDGASYSVLVLPNEDEMHPAVLQKIEQLVAAGGTVIGPKPKRAVGLEGHPESDHRVAHLAERLWGDLDGKTKTSRRHRRGRVIWGQTPREVLLQMGIVPDVTAPEGIDYIHRRDGGADIYFIRNTISQPASAAIAFRIKDREPELWDPVSGQIRIAPAWRNTAQATTDVRLDFARHGSMFVVFRRHRTQPPPPPAAPPQLPAPLVVDSAWTVDFEGGPSNLIFPKLDSWTTWSDPQIRYFAGTARYRGRFQLPAGWRKPGLTVHIDLGHLWTIGEVWLNGVPLGITWTPPFTLNTGNALRDGENELTVEVTNTWYNRLVGDARLPPEKRITRTNVTASGFKPWEQLEPLNSGLFGPVRIVAKAGD